LKEMHAKENWFLFPASRCIVTVMMQLYSEVDIGMGIV